MNEQRKQSINHYLRQRENQARIWKSIQQARQHVTVTISRAASLFDFSESKLREWEKRGLLQTTRPLLAPVSKGATGHRQYSQAELDKLAIIKDLLEHGYALNDIPPDVDQLWSLAQREEDAPSGPAGALSQRAGIRQLAIDTRVEQLGQQAFWRYFVMQALRLSLALLCEDLPDTALAGLILPLQGDVSASALSVTTSNLASLGPVCIGWRGRDGSFYTFLDDEPAFEYPSDFRCETFPGEDESEQGALPLFVIVQRKARPLSLTPERSSAIRRLLLLVFVQRAIWRPCFDYGRRDGFYQASAQDVAEESTLVQGLLEQVIALGEGRWTFCVLLLPRDSSLPVQQQSLVVCAQTRQSPFEVGLTAINAQHLGETNSLTLRALQSGQIILAPAALAGEQMTHPLHLKVITSTPQSIRRGPQVRSPQPPTAGEAVHSAIAVPLPGEHGISLGVMYIEAAHAEAFGQEDQRLLRLIGRMLEELLQTAHVRTHLVGRIGHMFERPGVVDVTFDEFAGETDFLREITALLSRIEHQHLTEAAAPEEVSILSVDIDNQSSIAMKYGNRVARNLSQQVGLRIARHLRTASGFRPERLYHISADKYYILLEGVSLASACVQARQLQSALNGTYLILPTSATPERPAQPVNMLSLPDVTVHIGVSSYPYQKLNELLKRYPLDTSHIYVRALIVAGTEELLERGKNDGGNCIFTWDRVLWGYRRLE
jgi:DNA-binding transcriptional MerR regulator/GGDEF domain-containing protein